MTSRAVAAPPRPAKAFTHPGIPARMTEIAQQAWKQCIKKGDCCVDATAGNGSDTLWLSRAVGPAGQVYSMDLQAHFSFATARLVASAADLTPMCANLLPVGGCH